MPEFCGDIKFNSKTQFCFDGTVIDKCGDREYNPATHGCDVTENEIIEKCIGGVYVISGNPCGTDGNPEIIDAMKPVITIQPASSTVMAGTAHVISVTANVTDGGTLNYQWYGNTSESNSGGWIISGATNSSYSISTSETGTFYYYAIVTNTNSLSNGNKTATVISDAAAVTVSSIVNAAKPLITDEPQNVSVEAGNNAELNVTASSPDDGTLSYQWYSNTTASNSNGTAIANAANSSYSVPVSAEGTFYYYVVVTNTNTKVNGEQTAVSTSRAATVEATAVGVVDAAFPLVSVLADLEVKVGESAVLSVLALSPDNGALSYQWYSNTSENNSGGTEIPGAVTASYNAPTSAGGTFYYYVVVTNTNAEVNGRNTSVYESRAAKVTVIPIVNATTPSINAQPQGGTVTVGTVHSISVTAGVSGGGVLSYQWYRNTSAINTGGTAIGGETNYSYAVPTAAEGTFHYYVVVTNTNNSVNGNKTATAVSDVVTITVNALVNAMAPNITGQPASGSVTLGTNNYSVSVNANVTDGGTLSYQWYRNNIASNSNGTIIDGETSALYNVPTNAAGIFYYYAVVTNTNNSVNGNKTAMIASNAVTITVIPPHLNPNINYGSFTDPRDDQHYYTVVIGTQTWMAENLNYAGATGDVGVCYGTTAEAKEENCAKYGRLYNWAEAMDISSTYNSTLWPGDDSEHQGICPNGWRLPSHEDWKDLISAVGSPVATKLRTVTGWFDGSGYIAGTNESGFSALPGGIRSVNFIGVGNYGSWWSATAGEANARRRYLGYYYDDFVSEIALAKTNQSSVRCLRD